HGVRFADSDHDSNYSDYGQANTHHGGRDGKDVDADVLFALRIGSIAVHRDTSSSTAPSYAPFPINSTFCDRANSYWSGAVAPALDCSLYRERLRGEPVT